MLSRCGYLVGEKRMEWLHMHRVAKITGPTQKKNFHLDKPHLLRRKWNCDIAAHRWYNPFKYKGKHWPAAPALASALQSHRSKSSAASDLRRPAGAPFAAGAHGAAC